MRILRLADDGASYISVASSRSLTVSDVDLLALVRQAATDGTPTWRDHLPARVAQILADRGKQGTEEAGTRRG
jgi:hypothetical protein